MKPRRQRKSVESPDRSLSDDYQADDQAAISRFFRSRSERREPPRKTLQLCRQVAQTLNALLSGECRDDVLQSLYVESVTPAPDATQLLVTVQSLDPQLKASQSEILTRLKNASGWLRAEVAMSITRRKAPQLIFQVHPQPAVARGPSEMEGDV